MIELNVKKLLCPLPVIRLSEAINNSNIGDEIKLLATDIGVLHDIPAWCKVHKHQVLDIKDNSQENNEIIIIVKKTN